jgi:N6-L-threonylcarbamoyladenine synthase
VITLGIESSCDETALALLEKGRIIKASVISSQIATHAKYGGVVPEIASRQHLQSLRFLFSKLLQQADMSVEDIEQIAVANGPGLLGCLMVGTSFAKGLAYSLSCPLIPVNHVRSHIYGALLSAKEDWESLFPAMSLVVSGGHTHVYIMESLLDFTLKSHTQDDACGECFDKVAKLLDLPYPGGKYIEEFARKGDSKSFKMPVIMPKSLNFSYSGLKTHMLYLLKKQKYPLSEQLKSDICASLQEAAFMQIASKSKSICEAYQNGKIKSILIGGGVSANLRLQDILKEELSLPLYAPRRHLCSDNAEMVAAYGYQLSQQKPYKKYSWEDKWQSYSRYGQEI